MGCAQSSAVAVAESERRYKEEIRRQESKLQYWQSQVEDAPGEPPEDPGVVGNCLLCLPESAVRVLGIKPNIDDKGDTEKRLWLGRVWQLQALELKRYRREVLSKQPPLTDAMKKQIDDSLKDPHSRDIALKMQRIWRGAVQRRTSSLRATLASLAYHPSAISGTVLFMHGSGGMTYNNVRYARTLAGMGYLVVAPDSMAGGRHRHRDLAGIIRADTPTPYWDDLGLYTSDAAGELTYSTQADAVVKDPEKWQKLYEKVFRHRSAEMHWILKGLPQQIGVRGVFTMGQSEGAMSVARFDDRRYGAMIRGRIISAFSVEYCYFTPTREAATYGGCPEVATLNLIGDADQFFGPINSVALSVNNEKGNGGWGADNFTGNGFKEMKQKKLRRGLVCVMEGAKHDPSETHDNFLRDVLRAFLATPSDCHRIKEQFKLDRYLHSKCEVVDEDREGGGIRQLMRVGKMDLPSTLPYSQELVIRSGVWKKGQKLSSDFTDLLANKQAEREAPGALLEEVPVEETPGRVAANGAAADGAAAEGAAADADADAGDQGEKRTSPAAKKRSRGRNSQGKRPERGGGERVSSL